MDASIRAGTKKRGRPKTTGKGEQIGVRLHDPMLSALDRVRAERGAQDSPSRPDVIRSILAQWLQENGYLPKGECK